MNWIRSHISRKIAISIAIVMMMILAVFFYITFQQDKQDIQEASFREIRAIGVTLVAQINAREHELLAKKYTETDQINKNKIPPRFTELIAPLRKAHKMNGLDTPIYTLRLNETKRQNILAQPDKEHQDGTQFILMSAEEPYYRHYYRYHPRMKDAFFNGRVVRFPPYTDEHGSWISVYVPIRSTSGETVAILEIDKHMDELYNRNSQVLFKKLVLMSILLVIGIFIIMAVSLTIVRPLRQLTGAAKALGAGDYDTAITVKSRDEVGTLSSVLDGARQEINGFVTRILDVVPGVMFTFGIDGRIAPHSSRSTRQLAGRAITGESMAEVFFQDSKAVKDVADMAFDPASVLPFKDLMGLMPESLHKDGNEFKLQYLPVAGDEELREVFVFGRDVTEENRLRKQIAQENRLNKMFISIIKNRLLFENFVEESHAGFDRAFELLDQETLDADDIGELFRITHSLKGSAATLNLYSIAEPAHHFEDHLAGIRKQGQMEDVDNIREKYRQLKEKLLDVIARTNELVGEEEGDSTKIENWEIDSLREKVSANDTAAAISLLESLHHPSLHSYVTSKARAVFDRTLEMVTEKQALLEVHCQKARVDADVVRTLDVVLSHGIRNAMDHGLEEEMERMDVEKELQGCITVTGKIQDNQLTIEIRDDGRGIDPAVIADIAVKKGVVSQQEVKRMTDTQKINLVTAAGFSTAEKTTEVSGRGVGMDAVKAKVQEAGGTLEILSRTGEGSTLKVMIPLT